ncbi:Transthyretin-like family protein [Caenorhabditis elegans]|uniref:Transthyretin-like family protein n=1 Tax=Caenorhabditis elegans TaxID=6239 RepID=O17345_CAEEL|nr:Transthyretin-like family protein [Caenorhabditis elegans]CCD69940.1 Transthyretin-like family protein [Caenorhabditis elegans]|eukprot:NP_509110.1 TransThyretin-Related family domain [Caenorhabditis elegans]
MRSVLIVCALFGVAASIEMFGRDQSSAVRGKLICDGRPASGVLVKLWDKDTLDSDDLLDSGTTDGNGDFHLAGWTKEYTPIDVKLNIYHDCNDGIKPCQRKFGIKIPDSYTSSGKVPKKVYDAGVIQLAGSYPGESRDCIH